MLSLGPYGNTVSGAGHVLQQLVNFRSVFLGDVKAKHRAVDVDDGLHPKDGIVDGHLGALLVQAL